MIVNGSASGRAKDLKRLSEEEWAIMQNGKQPEEKNPKDDAAWNEFITTLDNIGRSELMEIAQQAYDRK